MLASIIAFLMSPAVLSVLGVVVVAVLDVVVASMRDNHPLLAQLLAKIADLLRSNKLAGRKPLLAILVLFALAGSACADTITTTDGKQYTRAKDGHYYPSAYVRADGSVHLTPAAAVKPSCCQCKPHLPGTPWDGSNCGYYVCPTNGGGGQHCPCFKSCSGGSCAMPSHPMGGLPVYRNPLYSAPAAMPSCSSCPGGVCYPASPFGFRRR